MRMLADLFLTFARIGAFTFGGGYAMLALLEHECVEKKGWLTEDEMAEVTVIAESTPGPIAINCATFTGMKQAGVAGAVAATLGMTLPSFLVLLGISAFFRDVLSIPVVSRTLEGLRIAAALLILRAGLNMLGNIRKKTSDRRVATGVFALFFLAELLVLTLGLRVPVILLLLAASVWGCAFSPRREAKG